MTVTISNIIPRKEVEVGITSQYIADSRKTVIDKFTVTNTGASESNISIYLPDISSSPSASNCVLFVREIAAGETYLCPELVGQVIEVGGSIHTDASALGFTISASGREIT
jgi:hypothetical protein